MRWRPQAQAVHVEPGQFTQMHGAELEFRPVCILLQEPASAASEEASAEVEEPDSKLGDEVIDLPTVKPEDNYGDIYLSGDDVVKAR